MNEQAGSVFLIFHHYVWSVSFIHLSVWIGMSQSIVTAWFSVTIIIIIIISTITVFAGVLFVHQLGANHAPGASVTQVNLSVHTLSTFLRIHADPSMQTF